MSDDGKAGAGNGGAGNGGDGNRGDGTERMPVLSVTYGSFSLTLEGFEDPFATMRDVAEYFRKVLSEDREFGTQPATPRFEALRRVAEERAGRTVEARAGRGQVHLRAGARPPVRLRAVPDAGLLFDEEATPAADAGAGMPVAPCPPQPAAEADTAGAGGNDALASALDAAPADALPADDDAAGEAAGDEDALRPPAAGRRPALPPRADEAALERLMSRTDSALAGAEAQRRQATFAQLKAAVAATRAEADAGGGRSPGRAADEIARYRDVLAQSGGTGAEPASRRARPEAGPAEAAEPVSPGSDQPTPDAAPDPVAPPRPELSAAMARAPLILLAERRVAGKDTGAARPRRIDPATLTMDALFDEGAPTAETAAPEFSRFLAGIRPDSLVDLIDAAAAYLTHAERLEDFPRLQLMRLISARTAGERREEVMRAFGLLLRDGRLRRSRRGQLQSGGRSAYAEAARQFRTQR